MTSGQAIQSPIENPDLVRRSVVEALGAWLILLAAALVIVGLFLPFATVRDDFGISHSSWIEMDAHWFPVAVGGLVLAVVGGSSIAAGSSWPLLLAGWSGLAAVGAAFVVDFGSLKEFVVPGGFERIVGYRGGGLLLVGVACAVGAVGLLLASIDALATTRGRVTPSGRSLPAPESSAPRSRHSARYGRTVAAGGVLVAAMSWRFDEMSLGADNGTIDPWQVAGIVLGIAVFAFGIGLVASAIPATRTSAPQRTFAGAASAITLLGAVLAVVSLLIHFSGGGYRCTYRFGAIPSWQVGVVAGLAAVAVSVWALIGLWRANSMTPRISLWVYWAATVVFWVLMIDVFRPSRLCI